MAVGLSNFFCSPRIYFLVENRENAEDPSFETNLKAQRLFNEKILLSLYQPGDVILVEDSAVKDLKFVCRDQLPTLDAHKFNVRGWYDPAVCESRNSLEASIDEIKTKLDAVRMPFSMVEVEKRIEAYNILHDYASQFPLPEFVIGPLISKEELLKIAKEESFNEGREILLMCCELYIEKSKLKHIEETFPLHQASLQKVPVDFLREGANRVFVIIGNKFQEPSLTNKFPFTCKVLNDKSAFEGCLKVVQEYFSVFSGSDRR